MNMRRSIPSELAGIVTVGIVLSIVLFSESTALAQFGGRGGGRRGSGGERRKPEDSDSRTAFTPLPPPAMLLPHGGEYLSTDSNYYEIVYMPLQTRIYLYDNKFKPLSARDVHAQMSIHIPLEDSARKVPFQFVSAPAGVTEQDYVAANFDVRPLQDKETSIGFEFSGLSSRTGPTASFTPHYTRFKVRPYVAQASLVDADRDAISRQNICPVTGAVLGTRGQVIKLYVAEFPLYVSGEDCIAAVRTDPRKYVPQAPPQPNSGQ